MTPCEASARRAWRQLRACDSRLWALGSEILNSATFPIFGPEYDRAKVPPYNGKRSHVAPGKLNAAKSLFASRPTK